MKKNIAILAVSALLLAGVGLISAVMPSEKTARVAQNKALDFTLVNQTGYDIEAVYIAPTGSKSWGDDVMSGDAIKNGKSVEIVFNPKASAKLWDMSVGWVGYDPEEDVIWEKFDLSTVNKITLKYDEKTDKTWAETE